MTANSHWHEWVAGRVLLVRHESMWAETESAWDAVYDSQAMFPRAEIQYKRCRRCGKVLF